MRTSKTCRRNSEQEGGFGLVEIMVSLLIFVIAVLAIDGVLITSNQNSEEAMSVLNLQKNGMNTSAQSSVIAAAVSVNSASSSSNVQTVSIPVNITVPPSGSVQSCSSGIIGLVSSAVTSIVQLLFGSNQTPGSSPNPTAVTVSVPMVSIQDPGNQNTNMAWWLP